MGRDSVISILIMNNNYISAWLAMASVTQVETNIMRKQQIIIKINDRKN